MSEPRNRLAEIVSDSLASATMGSDYVEAPEFSDEPGSLYVARLTNELASRGVTLAASERPPVDPLREALHTAIGGEFVVMDCREPGAVRMGNWAAVDALMPRIRATLASAAPVATLHTCWDNHEGPDGTHADGSPCRDKATPLFASPAAPRPEGLDVERLRAAISEAQMNLWGHFPGGFSHDDLSAEAAHIYGLSDTGEGENHG